MYLYFDVTELSLHFDVTELSIHFDVTEFSLHFDITELSLYFDVLVYFAGIKRISSNTTVNINFCGC